MSQPDLFNTTPNAEAESTPAQPDPADPAGPERQANDFDRALAARGWTTTDANGQVIAGPDKTEEPQGYLSPRTTGADGKPIPQYWMPKIGPPPERRDTSRKALEHNAHKKADKRANQGKKYRSAVQIAEDMDEQKENEEL